MSNKSGFEGVGHGLCRFCLFVLFSQNLQQKHHQTELQLYGQDNKGTRQQIE